MARQCVICGKSSRTAWRLKKLRGKYNPTVKQRKYPNLQWAVVPNDIKRKNFKEFAGKRVKACTRCIRTMHKLK